MRRKQSRNGRTSGRNSDSVRSNNEQMHILKQPAQMFTSSRTRRFAQSGLFYSLNAGFCSERTA